MTKEKWTEQVYKAIEEKGWNIQKLAYHMNRSNEYIYGIFSGRRESQKGVDAVSKYLGIENYEVKKNEE